MNTVSLYIEQPSYLQFVLAVHNTLLLLAAIIKLRKWKALMKHSLHGKIATSVLLKLFKCGNEISHINH